MMTCLGAGVSTLAGEGVVFAGGNVGCCVGLRWSQCQRSSATRQLQDAIIVLYIRDYPQAFPNRIYPHAHSAVYLLRNP